ncbi:MAG: hypothetical protein ACXAC5_00110 [Promethearchaeota archaeon]|jgi:hypothetical protein
MYNTLQEFGYEMMYQSMGNNMDTFERWWTIHKSKSKEERLTHYRSLSKEEQFDLRRSFLEDGWCELFCQNHIDRCLDLIKTKHSIDLIALRIQALNNNKVFLIEKDTWEEIEHMILEYEPLFNSDILFGGLYVKPWGRRKQFVVISAQRRKIDA